MSATGWLFAVFAFMTCGGAIAVAVSQNVVRMAFWLIVSLGSTAGLFFLLHADFVAATQLLIYVGGTLVLLIFGVMLTASGPYVSIKTSPADGVVAACIGLLFLAMIYTTINRVPWGEISHKVTPTAGHAVAAEGYNPPDEGNTARPIGLKLIGISLEDVGADENKPLSTGYLLPFEIASVHLLVVLIGAAYMARAKRRVDRNELK